MAELLSGSLEMAEATSPTLNKVKNWKNAPGRTREKLGSGAQQ